MSHFPGQEQDQPLHYVGGPLPDVGLPFPGQAEVVERGHVVSGILAVAAEIRRMQREVDAASGQPPDMKEKVDLDAGIAIKTLRGWLSTPPPRPQP